MLLALWLFFATAIVPLLLLVEAPIAALAACNLVVGLGFGLFDTIWNSTVQHRIPAERVSRVSAWDWMGSLAGMPLGFALAGVLTETVGRSATLAGMAVATFVICVVFILDRDVRALGSELAGAASTGTGASNYDDSPA